MGHRWKSYTANADMISNIKAWGDRPLAALSVAKLNREGIIMAADGPNNWRIRPPAAAAHRIHQMALRENRSLTNMLSTLVLEALAARDKARARVEREDDRVSAWIFFCAFIIPKSDFCSSLFRRVPSVIANLKVRMPAACRCGSEIAVVDDDHQLTCGACQQRRGFLSPFTSIWLESVIHEFGRPLDPIELRPKHSIISADQRIWFMQYDNSNSGYLFRNTDKKDEKDRDFAGALNVNGVEYWVSAYAKISKKNGQKFLSLKVKPKNEQPQRRPIEDSIDF
jgi:hypothetical protein